MSRNRSNSVSGTDEWIITVNARCDHGWFWSVYPPRLAQIPSLYGVSSFRWLAVMRAERAVKAQQRYIARRAKRRAAAIYKEVSA